MDPAAYPHQMPLNVAFARLQFLENTLQSRDAEIRALRAQCQGLLSEKDTRTESDHCVFVKTSKVLRQRRELGHSQRAQRTNETKDAFRKVAGIVEGGKQEGGGDIQSVYVVIHYKDGEKTTFWAKGGEIDGADRMYSTNDLQRILEAKVRHRVSYQALHELRMVGVDQIPPVMYLKNEYSRLCTCIPILQPSGPLHGEGRYRRLEDILSEVLKMPKYAALLEECENTGLLLRFAADGAKITKNKGSVTGVFRILPPKRDELTAGQVKCSPDEEFTLFFYMGNEDRPNLEYWLQTGTSTLDDMKAVAQRGIKTHNEKTIPVTWVLSCDWKAMALLKGINPANAMYFCLWCECPKSQIRDFSVPAWPTTRAADRQMRCLEASGVEGKRGYAAHDFFPWIPYSHVVPDELHLRMRITGKLVNQVVRWAIELKATKQLMEEMRRIHVDFAFFEERGHDDQGKIFKWTQPSGDDLQKVLAQFKIANVLGHGLVHVQALEKMTVHGLKLELSKRGLSTSGQKTTLLQRLKNSLRPGERVAGGRHTTYEFSDDEDETSEQGANPDEDIVDVEELQDIWRRFADLVQAMKALPGTEKYLQSSVFQETARQWATDFRKVTFDGDVIPYIHCLVYHVPEALHRFKYLADIGISQVERKNYDRHLNYFGASSREGGTHGKTISQQMLERENLLIFFTQQPGGEENRKRRKVRSLDCSFSQTS